MKKYQKESVREKIRYIEIQLMTLLEVHQCDPFLMGLKDRVEKKCSEIKEIISDVSES